MMADIKIVKAARLHSSLAGIASASAAIRAGIADHAEKHAAKMDDARRQAGESHAIQQRSASQDSKIKGTD